jgi:hypothetical protein
MDEAWEQITLANSDAGDEARRANKVELDDARPTLSALQDLVRKFETALDLVHAKCAAFESLRDEASDTLVILKSQSYKPGPDQIRLLEEVLARCAGDNPGQHLLDQLKTLERLREKVQGFKDHGEAKNGTHGTLMFEALAAVKEAHGPDNN